MVLRGHHGPHAFPVRKRQHGNLRPGEELLQHDAAARIAEDFVLHHRADRALRLSVILGDHDALAEREAVRFDDDGVAAPRADPAHRRRGIVEHLVIRGGNAVLFHQIFGEHLAALDDRGVFARAEGGDPGILQGVDHAGRERIVRRHEHQPDPVAARKAHRALHVVRRDRHALGVAGDAAVPGRAVNFLRAGALHQLADNGVLAPAAADHQNFHDLTLLK